MNNAKKKKKKRKKERKEKKKEENNRMGKTRDFFKKIGEIKGTFKQKQAQLKTEMART